MVFKRIISVDIKAAVSTVHCVPWYWGERGYYFAKVRKCFERANRPFALRDGTVAYVALARW